MPKSTINENRLIVRPQNQCSTLLLQALEAIVQYPQFPNLNNSIYPSNIPELSTHLENGPQSSIKIKHPFEKYLSLFSSNTLNRLFGRNSSLKDCTNKQRFHFPMNKSIWKYWPNKDFLPCLCIVNSWKK